MARLNNRRSKWLLGSGSAALAVGLVLMPSMASAQAIQANETVQSGVVERIITSSLDGFEEILVLSEAAVIDWEPLDDGQGNALDFLRTGSEVRFENGGDVTDFSVLNRILPSANGNIAVFDGTVISRVNGAPGGTVAFYSPTGILVGSNAAFDVGNLVLTTLDVDLASFDDFAINGGPLALGGQPTTARIEISPGAQIVASAENSFFAVTAAEIQMFGTSNINGSQAYVAGEAVNITVSNGLFDIQIPVGTTIAEPIIFDGDVGGPSSMGVGDNHLIYAVAAAQNDPISLLFSGNLGFAPATGAGIVNGEIILSANYDVFGRSAAGGAVDGPADQLFDQGTASSAAQGSIFAEDIISSSTLLAVSNFDVRFLAFDQDSLIDGNLLISGDVITSLEADNGQIIDITGFVNASASASGGSVSDFVITTGGGVLIEARDGALINIGGDLFGAADAAGAVNIDEGLGAIGGTVDMVATAGGAISVAGNVFLASRGGIESDLFDYDDVFGGRSAITADAGGTIDILGSAELTSSAFAGGSTFFPGAGDGGNAFGGDSILEVFDGGTITIAGNVGLLANATAGASNISGAGSVAQAGNAFALADGTAVISVATLNLDAQGVGGDNLGGTGGEGLGGIARAVTENGGSILIADSFTSDARGFGGGGIDGGNGFGGAAGVAIETGTVDIGGQADAAASGTGGNATIGFGGDGGTGTGGLAFLQATGTLTGTASLTIGNGALVTSSGTGGQGGSSDGVSIAAGNGGDGFGGAARTRVDNGASLDLGGNYRAEATGRGGAGAIRGGDGFGGIAGLSIDTGFVNISGSADAVATGFGGSGTALDAGGSLTLGGDGGDGTGGNAFLQADGSATGTATLIIALDAIAVASGFGGDAGGGDGEALLPGRGGNGIGGQGGTPNQADPIFNSGAFVLAGGDNGNINVGGLTRVTANGLGGAGGVGGFGQAGGDGGDGLGGLANGGQSPFGGDGSIAAGTANFADLSIASGGFAGQGGLGGSSADLSGISGSATGGTARLTAFAGVVNAGNVAISTSSFGAIGEVGGNATGGEAAILGQLGATINLVSFSLRSVGGGGFGNSLGGDGIGGISRIILDEASLVITDAATDLNLNAGGQAGGAVAGAAGASSGGTARISLSGPAAQLTLPAGLLLEASTLSAQSDFAGQAAAANGGVAELILDNGANTTILGGLTLNASAGGGFNSQGQGGDALAGIARVRVDGGAQLQVDTILGNANAGSGEGIGAGDAFGGVAEVTIVTGTIDVANSVSLQASGSGRSASVGTGGDGGDGFGGAALISVQGNLTDSASLTIGGDAFVVVRGTGGIGGIGDDGGNAPGRGGSGTGGKAGTINQADALISNGASILTGGDNGQLTIAGLTSVIARGTGGDGGTGETGQAGGDGGNGTGGTVQFGQALFGGDGSSGNGTVNVGFVSLIARGFNGNGGVGGSGSDPLGQAGINSGGDAIFSGVAGTIVAGDVSMLVEGYGGNGESGGDAISGTAQFVGTFGGNATLTSLSIDAFGLAEGGSSGGGDAVGGVAEIDLNNYALTTNTGLSFRTFAESGNALTGFGGSATGGTSRISVAGPTGALTVNGDVILDAAVNTGSSNVAGQATTGTAGLTEFNLLDGASANISGTLLLRLGAFGGDNAAGLGGDGFGGIGQVLINDGALQIDGELLIDATGGGGNGVGGGDGFGGVADVSVIEGSIVLSDRFSVGAVGQGGNASFGSGGDGGDGFGGLAGLQVLAGTVDISGPSVDIFAFGIGGSANFGFGGNGGIGRGGGVVLSALGNANDAAVVTIQGNVTIQADGTGGAGGTGDGVSIAAGNGGDGFGGDGAVPNQADGNFNNGAYVLGGGDNGFLTVNGAVSVISDGEGGIGGAGGAGQVGGDGGNGLGGTAQAGQALLGGDGSIGAGVVSLGLGNGLVIEAIGAGGDGGLGGGPGLASGNGGNGTGGRAFLTSRLGTLNVGATLFNAEGIGAAGEIGGIGIGGTASVQTSNSALNADALDFGASGFGGAGNAVGGEAIGGTASLNFDASTMSIGGRLLMRTDAFAGNAANGVGGNATGGNVEVFILDDDSSLNVDGDWDMQVFAFGGNGSSTAPAGLGTGGLVTISLDALTNVTVGGRLFVDAIGTGGNNLGTGAGGGGLGGEIDITLDGGALLQVGGQTGLGTLLNSAGQGGTGFGGGNGLGGSVNIAVLNGSFDMLSGLSATANGVGGNAVRGDGGIGRGGSATLNVIGSSNDLAVVNIQGDADIRADGNGGAGGAGDGGAIAAGNGGDGFGGRDTFAGPEPTFGGVFIEVGAEGGTLTISGRTDVTADGDGGVGGDGGIGQAGGDGGNASGGVASLDVRLQNLDVGSNAGFASFGDLIIEALAIGGDGGNGGGVNDQRGSGGDASAFRASLSVGAGALTAGTVDISADAEGGDGFNGGIAIGGELASMTNGSGGSITIDTISITAGGSGGDSFGGVAGIGQGGEALLGFDGGGTLINFNAMVQADGSGGAGNEGDGADGTSGNATIANNNGSAPSTLTVNGDAFVFANGFGGDGASGFTGGTGTGGNGTLRAQLGSVINLGSLVVSGSGEGGSGTGAVGGDGFGGTAGLVSTGVGTQIIIQNENQFGQPVQANAALLAANGVGGDTSGGSGIGGTGTGGAILLSAIGGGAITLSPGANFGNRLLARGIGGGASVDGGTGGAAIGGTVTVLANNGTIDAGRMLFSAAAIGGNSADFNLNISGGDGSGGERDIEVRNNGELTVELFGGTSGGSGGFGSGTGNGGNSSGEQTRLTVDNGTVNFVGNSILFTQTLSGEGTVGGSAIGGTTDVVINGGTINILANANGDARLEIGATSVGGRGTDQSGDAQAGDINATITNSTITGGDLFVTATAFSREAANQGGNAVGGNIVFTLSDTVINAGTMNVNANAFGGDGGDGTVLTGNGGNAEGGQVVVDATGSSINLLGSLSVQAQGFGANGLVGGKALGGAAQLNLAQTNILVGLDANQISEVLIDGSATGGQSDNQNGDATGGTAGLQMLDSTIDAVALTIVSDGVGLVNQGNALADGGQATAGLVDAMIEGASSITVDTFALLARANSVESGFANGGQANFVMSGGSGDPDVTAQLMDINVSAMGAGGLDTPANTVGVFDVQVLSGQMNLVTFNGSALGDLVDGQNSPSSLTAIGGDLLISGEMNIDVLDDFNIATGQGGIIGGPMIASPTAQIVIRADTVRIDGDDESFISFGGDQTTIESFDIEVLDGARFGANTLNLVSRDLLNPTFLGGASGPVNSDPTLGYVLSQEEAERIEANNFFFLQPTLGGGAPNDPDIIIGELLANGGFDDGVTNMTVGTTGTGGIIRIEGAVSFFEADTINTLTFNADERIEIITPGSLTVVDTSGNPTGALSLNAGNIWVADAALIAQLQADQNFAGRNDDLSNAIAGSDDPLGYVRAGTVNIEVAGSLSVRNTGTTAQPGGILVGDGGLSITAPTTQAEGLDVFAYGARIDGNGNTITGNQFFGEVTFNTGDTNYDADAQFNDCNINTGDCVIDKVPPVTNPAVVEAPVMIVEVIVETEQEANDDFGMDFPSLVWSEEIKEEAEVEEPVAAGGDSSLYSSGKNGGGN